MKRDRFFQSTYLRAADIPPEGITLTIRNCVEKQIGKQRERKPVLSFEEEPRGLVLNMTNWGVLEHLYGDESDDWAGRQIELFTTEVEFAGQLRPAIRLRAPKNQDHEDDSIAF